MSATPAHCPVDGLTIDEALKETVRKFPERDALVFTQLNYRCNYRQFDEAVEKAARGLLALGIRKGEHVAVWATNIPEWAILQMATARIGAVLVTVNPAYHSSELSYVLKQGDIAALFLIDAFKASDYHATLYDICPELAVSKPGALSSAALPLLRVVVAMRGVAGKGMVSWQDMLKAGERVSGDDVRKVAQTLQPNEAINIQYTSGTTGFPKAAVLSHRNILMNAWYVTGCQNITERDRMCVPVPFYHCFGLVMGTLGAMVRGAALVIPAEYFNPAATLDAIEKERATTLYGVPTMFIAMLDDPSFAGRDLASLRSGIMAGSPCPIEVMKQVIAKMHMREVTIAYGLTEFSPVITQTRADDPLEIRVNTVGRPLPGVEVKLIDSATGREVAPGEHGELCARGHGTMLGYYKNPAATAKTMTGDGWLKTGDIATCDPKTGCYSITGRIKDMVIRGGENIYPREIEEYLFTHPAIEQASVVGVPDDKYGEELCAWVKLKPGERLSEQELLDFCKGRLARYKIPRYVKFVDAFPQTVSGKIQKFKIREQMVAELGLKVQKTA